jgi:hypothetical protein
MLKAVLLLLFMTAATFSSALATPAVPIAENKSNGMIAKACPVEKLKESAFSLRGIESYLRKNHSSLLKLDTFLKCLPETVWKNAVTIYHSRSLQDEFGCVDEDNPRVLLHYYGQSTVLAYAGHSEKPQCNGVEILDLDAKNFKPGMVLESIGFDKMPIKQMPSLKESFGSVKLSKVNQSLCTQCHGADPSPIFDT